MSKRVAIDPLTRIEGHLAVETEVEDGRVAGARISGRMFRGFERLLVGRHPVDAARITQRICGICHEVHGIAASMALEDLYRVTPPRNGQILRELILGLHLATDHIFHFYQLSLPDYIDFNRLQRYRGKDARVQRLTAMFAHSKGTFAQSPPVDAPADTGLSVAMALGYAEAVDVRREAASGLASLGGKVPFCHAILPGGVTTDVSRDRLTAYAQALRKTADFIDQTYLPQALQLATHFKGYFDVGAGHGHFYGNGGFTLLDKPLFVAGVKRAGKTPEGVAVEKIAENIEHSWLDATGRPMADKQDAYSWVRALAYDGLPMEVGPLARMAVNADAGFVSLLKSAGQKTVRSSVMGRILARAYEAQQICRYLDELLPLYRPGGTTINGVDMQATPTGSGSGMSLAARGALNHRVEAKDGKVVAYQLQVPSAWNFGPAAAGQPGTVEQALLGVEVAPGQKSSIEVGRVVRSFDPCLACAIH